MWCQDADFGNLCSLMHSISATIHMQRVFFALPTCHLVYILMLCTHHAAKNFIVCSHFYRPDVLCDITPTVSQWWRQAINKAGVQWQNYLLADLRTVCYKQKVYFKYEYKIFTGVKFIIQFSIIKKRNSLRPRIVFLAATLPCHTFDKQKHQALAWAYQEL